MIKRKSTLKYYFSVEGETEQWYLEWLQEQINNAPEAACKDVLYSANSYSKFTRSFLKMVVDSWFAHE